MSGNARRGNPAPRAIRCRSASRWTPCIAMKPGPVTPRLMQARAAASMPIVATRCAALVARFQQVRLYRQVELARVDDDLLPAGVADRVRRVRRKRKAQPRLVFPCVARREPCLQVAVGVSGVSRRKIEHRQPEHRAHAAGVVSARGGVGKEIHVVAAGDAAAQHFRRGNQRSIVHEFRRRASEPSRGQMCSLQPRRSSATSSAMPRIRLIAPCACALTSPGISTCVASLNVLASQRSRGRPRRPGRRRRFVRRRRASNARSARRAARWAPPSADRGADRRFASVCSRMDRKAGKKKPRTRAGLFPRAALL